MQRKRRTLQELTFKDNFLFVATLLDPENCRLVLERILEIPIEHVEVSAEKSIVYHPEYKGVRLDVTARDEARTHYDVEMQIAAQDIRTRVRYYHSQMDMELILSGTGYDELLSFAVKAEGVEEFEKALERTLIMSHSDVISYVRQ